jgi:hypothetical protein
MNKTLRRQLAIASSVQLVEPRKQQAPEAQATPAPRANGEDEGEARVASREPRAVKRGPVRHAGINE